MNDIFKLMAKVNSELGEKGELLFVNHESGVDMRLRLFDRQTLFNESKLLTRQAIELFHGDLAGTVLDELILKMKSR